MGKITAVVIDDFKIPEVGEIVLPERHSHDVTIYYDCELWSILPIIPSECTTKFKIKINETVYETEPVKIPTSGGGHPVITTIGYIPTGRHTLTVTAYELTGYPVAWWKETDAKSYTIKIVPKEEWHEKYEEEMEKFKVKPIVYQGMTPYIIIAGAMIVGAVLIKSFTRARTPSQAPVIIVKE